MHEILHCLGFFHQQSAADRDDYVQIKWENIEDSHEHNFNKYNDSVVTDYGVSYDFQSIMHYSEKAFSKNGEKTIVPVSVSLLILFLNNVTVTSSRTTHQ